MNSKNKRIILISDLAVVLIILVAIAISLFKKDNRSVADETVVEEGITIETKYGEFEISNQWQDYFDYEISEDNNYTVDFLATYENNQVTLFSLVFGSDVEGGQQIGQIENDGKNEAVYIVFNKLEMQEDLPSEMQDAFYGMQEEVNTIIEQLNAMDNFTVAE